MMSWTASTAPDSSKVRLRRGVISRLVGDGIFGDFFPSQFMFAFAMLFVAPFSGWGWLVVGLLAVPAFLGLTVSYSVKGSMLVGSTCGIPILVLDLRGSGAGVEELMVSRGVRISVVFVEDGRVVRRFRFPFLQPIPDRTELGYSRAIGTKRRQAWLKILRDRS